MALEWFLEAISADVIELKFLNATTCLELLMDKFHSIMKTEFFLTDEEFDLVYSSIKSKASEKLKEIGIREEIRQAIYSNLRGLNRRSYLDKAVMMLDMWRINYSDLKVPIKEIVRIRNQITHTGTPKTGSMDDVLEAYYAILVILVRVFLALLQYRNLHYDMIRKELIPFTEVCKMKN